MCVRELIIGQMAGLIGTKLGLRIHLGPGIVAKSRSERHRRDSRHAPRGTEAGQMP